MAATFIERCIMRGDAGVSEDPQDNLVDLLQLRALLELYDSGAVDAAFIATALNLTQAQGTELDEVLATQPGVIDPDFERHAWVGRVWASLVAGYANGQMGWTGYTTASEVRVALGLSA